MCCLALNAIDAFACLLVSEHELENRINHSHVHTLCRKYTHPSKAGLQAAAYGAAPHLSTPSHHHDAATSIVHSALRTIVDSCTASSSARLRCLHSLPQLDRLRHGSRAEAKRGHGVVPRCRGDVHGDLTAAVSTFHLHPTSPQNAVCRSPAQRCAEHTAVCPMCAFAARHFLSGHACGEHTQPTLRSLSGASCSCSLEAVSADHSVHSPQPTASQHAQSPAQRAQPAAKSEVLQQLQRPSTGLSKGSTLQQLSRRLWDSIPCPMAQHAQHKSRPSTDSLLCSTPNSQLMMDSGRNSSQLGSAIPSSAGYSMRSAGRPSKAPNVLLGDSAMELSKLSNSSSSSTRADTHICMHRRQEAQRRWRLLQRHVWVTALERGLRRSMWESACSVALNSLAPAAFSCDRESFCSIPSSPASSTLGKKPGNVVSGDAAAADTEPVATRFGGGGIAPLAVLTAH